MPYLKKAVGLNPEDSDFNADLSMVEEKSKKYSDALKSLERALDHLDVKDEDYQEKSNKFKSEMSRLELLIKH